MKMRYVAAIAAVLGIGLSVALVGMVGCDTPSTSEPEGYFDDNPFSSLPRETPGDPDLTITPAVYSVTNASQLGQTLLFSAKGGREPITWDVANPSAGTIEPQPNGRDALYSVDTLKGNSVIARDAGGAAAVASVRGQDAPLLAISSSDDPNLVYDGELILLYAQGGLAPFTWSLVYPQRGQIVHYGGTFIEYMRVDEPDQVVILSDANGSMAELRITQPDEGSGTTNSPATPMTIVATPATLSTDTDLSLLRVSGGTPPYTWEVVAGMTSGGILMPNVGAEVIYQRNNVGDCAVVVTDGAGNTAYVIIIQP